MMTLKQRKTIIIAANTVIVITLVAATWCLVVSSVDVVEPDVKAVGNVNTGTPKPGAEPKTMSYYSVIGRKNLRCELYPKDKVTVARGERPLPFKLTGTAVSGGSVTAFLRTTSGKIVVASDGQMVEGAKIIKIYKDRIDVEFDERQKTLKINPGKGGI